MPSFDYLAVPVTFWLLFASVIALWSPFATRTLWMLLLSAATAAGLIQGYVQAFGVIVIVAMGMTTYLLAQSLQQNTFNDTWRARFGPWYGPSVIAVNIVFLAFGALLAAHKMPGFDSYRVIGGVPLHESAENMTIRFNFDKALIGLFFLAYCVERVRTVREWGSVIKTIIPIIIGAVLPAFVIAYWFGYVQFDPIWTSLIIAFTLANLLITSVAEEVFFRGWMQAGLARRMSNIANGQYYAILITSLIFGAAHLWGGIGLFIGAFLAGLGYGYAYYKTQRLEAAILTHFAFNGIHFTFFTYPILLQS